MDIQWTDSDPETGERRFVTAEKFARGWRFKTRAKRREDWQRVETPTRDMWETLLDAMERRYQQSSLNVRTPREAKLASRAS